MSLNNMYIKTNIKHLIFMLQFASSVLYVLTIQCNTLLRQLGKRQTPQERPSSRCQSKFTEMTSTHDHRQFPLCRATRMLADIKDI